MFNTFAEALVNRWVSLVCYIPEGRIGDVCWTLGKVEVPVEKTNKKKTDNPDELANAKKKLFLGLNLGGGVGYQEGLGGYWALGTDFAYPITRKFGLGAYLTFGQALYQTSYNERQPVFIGNSFNGYRTTYYTALNSGFHMTGGVQATIGDYSTKSACFIGVGGGIDGSASMADLRVGGIWANGFYFFGNVDLGSCPGGWKGETAFAFNVGVHFGYNFGRFIKCN